MSNLTSTERAWDFDGISWDGLDAEELVFRVVGAEPAGSWQSATVLPDLADFVRYMEYKRWCGLN